MKKISISLLVIVSIVAAMAYKQLTIFVIPPIAPFSEGETLVIARMSKTQFIDSAAAVCERTQGNTNVLCQGVALGVVKKEAKVYIRLPFSPSLYKLTTTSAYIQKKVGN